MTLKILIFLSFCFRCGHCTHLTPTWEKLAEEFNDASTETEVIIAKVDCTVETALCSEHDVTGYPTLVLLEL